MTTRIKLRRDTASNWETANPVLALGEAGFDSSNNNLRIGDGTTPWSDLTPIGGGLPVGMLAELRYGSNPQLTNDSDNSDADYMYIEVRTDWVDENNSGRLTMGWHDLNDNGVYNRVIVDPFGTTIKAVNWSGGNGPSYAYDWEFSTDGALYFPSVDGPFDNLQRYGMGNLIAVSDGGWTIGEFNGDSYGTEGIRICPGIEGATDMAFPSDTTANVTPIQIGNYAGGGLHITAGNIAGGQGGEWTFNGSGNITLTPTTDSNVTSYLGQGPDSDWVNPNNHTWSIRQYNGGFNFTYEYGSNPMVWFDPANTPLGDNHFRGAIIEYHAYVGGNANGTIVGQIIVAQDVTSEPTHTENSSFYGNSAGIKLWDRPNGATLGYSNSALTSGQTDNVMIMWTAKVFYGQEYAC